MRFDEWIRSRSVRKRFLHSSYDSVACANFSSSVVARSTIRLSEAVAGQEAEKDIRITEKSPSLFDISKVELPCAKEVKSKLVFYH